MHAKLSNLLAAALLTLGATGVALAAGDHGQHGAASKASSSASASTSLTAGEVRKVDLDQGKVTLKHEPIANLDMPSMTMVFRAKSPDLLKDLQVGDKIRFQAESVNGAIQVTQIEK